MKHQFTALVDCDGVLADFTTHALKSVGSWLRAEDVDEWDIFSLLNRKDTPGLGDRLRAILDGHTFWRTMPRMPGASQLVDRLVQEDFRVVVVTSPWVTCFGWDMARRDWLEENFDIKPHDVVITSRKELVRGDVFFDDRPVHVREWGRYNPHREGDAWLVDAPYNRDAEGLNRLILSGN